MNGGSNSCIGPLNTEGVSLNVNSKGVGDSYYSNSQGVGEGGGGGGGGGGPDLRFSVETERSMSDRIGLYLRVAFMNFRRNMKTCR